LSAQYASASPQHEIAGLSGCLSERYQAAISGSVVVPLAEIARAGVADQRAQRDHHRLDRDRRIDAAPGERHGRCGGSDAVVMTLLKPVQNVLSAPSTDAPSTTAATLPNKPFGARPPAVHPGVIGGLGFAVFGQFAQHLKVALRDQRLARIEAHLDEHLLRRAVGRGLGDVLEQRDVAGGVVADLDAALSGGVLVLVVTRHGYFFSMASQAWRSVR
jgi:hypothetical protein